MKHIVKQFFQREAHPLVQFIKYGICGGVATLVDVLIFYFLAWKVFQAVNDTDIVAQLLGWDVPVIDEAVRSRNFVINSCIAFIFSNLTAYLLNFYWVFHPGRHKRHVEIGLFYLVSVVSIALGTFLGWVMITVFGMSTTASYLGKMIASLLINFVCRKYIVFKK